MNPMTRERHSNTVALSKSTATVINPVTHEHSSSTEAPLKSSTTVTPVANDCKGNGLPPSPRKDSAHEKPDRGSNYNWAPGFGRSTNGHQPDRLAYRNRNIMGTGGRALGYCNTDSAGVNRALNAQPTDNAFAPFLNMRSTRNAHRMPPGVLRNHGSGSTTGGGHGPYMLSAGSRPCGVPGSFGYSRHRGIMGDRRRGGGGGLNIFKSDKLNLSEGPGLSKQ